MKKITSIPFILLLLCLYFKLQAQDIQFTQFYNVGVYYNPALTAIDNDLQATISSRKQWVNINGGLTSYYASIESKFFNKEMYLGLMTYNESLKGYVSSHIEISYAYRLHFHKFYLQAGFAPSLNQRKIDYDQLLFSDQLDPVYGKLHSTKGIFYRDNNIVYPDCNLGFVLKGKDKIQGSFIKPKIGFSVNHFLPIKDLNDMVDPKLVVHGELEINYKNHNSIHSKRRENILKPAGIFEYQGPFRTATLGTSYFWNLTQENYIVPGIWFRYWNVGHEPVNSIVIGVGYQLRLNEDSGVLIDYTYDFTSNDLGLNSGGSHEITLRYLLDYKKMFNPPGICIPLPDKGTLRNK